MEPYTILTYIGEVNNAVVKALVSATETKLDGMGFKKFVVKKINSVLIEILQNLANYAPVLGDDTQKLPTVELSQTDAGSIEIRTSNLVTRDQWLSIEHYLSELNQLGDDQLKELYQQKLSNGEFGAKGGAGLGFINIIRKTTDRRICANFAPADAGYHTFNLKVTI